MTRRNQSNSDPGTPDPGEKRKGDSRAGDVPDLSEHSCQASQQTIFKVRTIEALIGYSVRAEERIRQAELQKEFQGPGQDLGAKKLIAQVPGRGPPQSGLTQAEKIAIFDDEFFTALEEVRDLYRKISGPDLGDIDQKRPPDKFFDQIFKRVVLHLLHTDRLRHLDVLLSTELISEAVKAGDTKVNAAAHQAVEKRLRDGDRADVRSIARQLLPGYKIAEAVEALIQGVRTLLKSEAFEEVVIWRNEFNLPNRVFEATRDDAKHALDNSLPERPGQRFLEIYKLQNYFHEPRFEHAKIGFLKSCFGADDLEGVAILINKYGLSDNVLKAVSGSAYAAVERGVQDLVAKKITLSLTVTWQEESWLRQIVTAFNLDTSLLRALDLSEGDTPRE